MKSRFAGAHQLGVVIGFIDIRVMIDDSCTVRDVVTNNHICGGLRINDEFQSSVSSCIDEMDPLTETNVMSYGFVHDTMCPQFDTVNAQRARM